MTRLGIDFFNRNTLVVAIELLGKNIVFKADELLMVRIVEVEAYFGYNDPASHAFSGETKRNQLMFGSPGFIYVYFIYGNHFCLNFVTESKGIAGAVLIRAVEPILGLCLMRQRRNKINIAFLCNGPGKLTQALGINRETSGLSLFDSYISVEDSEDGSVEKICCSTRIGISKGRDLMYRFYLKENKFVSK